MWRGGFAQLGRLQYELIREDEGWVLNTHIPAEGAMGLDAVRASLARARETMQAAYPRSDRCAGRLRHSWLFDRQLPELLPGSNIAAFADLWDITPGESGSGDAKKASTSSSTFPATPRGSTCCCRRSPRPPASGRAAGHVAGRRPPRRRLWTARVLLGVGCWVTGEPTSDS